MNINLQDILNTLKSLKARDVAYPAVFIIFIIIIIVSFNSSVRFLSANINKAFGGDTALESTLLKLDFDGYNVIAKKLGIQKLEIKI
jgi:hypothetical protein